MPVYTSRGNRYNIPDDKVKDFLSKRNDAKLVDNTPYYISRTDSTPRQSNIQNQTDTQVEETPVESPERDMMGGYSGITDLGINNNIPTQGELNVVPGIDPLKKGKPLSETVRSSMQNMPASLEAQFDMSVDRYKIDKENIDRIKNDNTLSEDVKQTLINDYQNNIRTSDLTVDNEDLSPSAKGWLKRNELTKKVASGYDRAKNEVVYQDIKYNSPEQIAFIKDYEANSVEGKAQAKAHKEFIDGLEGEADTLLDQIEGIRDESARSKKEYAERHNISISSLKGTNYRNDALLDKASNLLKNTKLLLSSNREGGGFWKGLHMTDEDLKELAVLTDSFYNDKVLNQVIDKYQKDPNSLSKEENIIIQAKYIADQINADVDPGSWYNIGASTKQSLPFMRDFILTAPIGGSAANLVKSGVSALAAKTGANFLLSRGVGRAVGNLAKGAIDLSVRPAVQTMFSPSGYAMAFEEMQGQAVNKDSQGNIIFDNRKTQGHGMTSAFIENQSEVLGEVVLDKLFQKFRIPVPAFLKTNAAKRLSSATGIQSPLSEYTEEKYSDLANIVRGEQTIEGFFDPRSNLETFGAVAIMQIPFTAINSTGYGIGKIQDVQAKRAMRKAYETSLSNLNSTLGQDAAQLLPTLNDVVENGSDIEIQEFLLGIVEDQDISEEKKRSIGEYVTAYSAYSGVNKAKTEQVEEATQEIPAMIEENVNPEMGAVVSATIAGMDTPVQITGGNIVQNEDGTINRGQSDQEIYYTDADGKRQVTSINYVENITENIPTQDAIAQVTEQVAAPIIAQQQNEEVRPYQAGETVRFSPDGNTSLIGQIEGQDQATGNYLLSVETPNGIQQMQVQPRQIINEDNLEGIENGSPVIYTNQNGEQVQDVVATTPDLYAQGLIGFENGDVVPVANVIGLAGNNEQISQSENVPMSDNMQGTTQQNEGTVSAEQSSVQPNEPRVFEIEEGLSAVENADGTYALDKQFAKSELKKADSLVKRLNEDYSDNGLAFETVQLPRKDASNPFEKPLWGVVARMQPETVSNPQPIVTDNTPVQPLERKQEKPVKKDTRPKKPTPFQRRLQAVEPNVSTVRDRILYGIASGAYKFRWKDQGVSMGLAREFGLTGSETERRSRISLLSNNGYTPSTLAHRIWEETGMQLNDNDIRNEVIEVLSSISSPKQALETLESSLSMNEDTYYQEQQDAAEFEQEQIRQAQTYQEEISDQLAAEDIEKLLNLADELGLPLEELGNTYTTFDLVTQLEQLEEIQNEQETDIHTRREGTSEETDSVASRSGNPSETTERTVGERNRSSEEAGDRTSDRDSQNDYSDLTAEEQSIVDETNALIDAEVNDVSTQLQQKKSELNAAKKRIGNAYAEDNQTNLFGQEQTSDTLFDVPRDFSQSNVANIIEPIQQEVNTLTGKLNDLNNSRNERVNEALENFRSQGTIDFKAKQPDVAIPEYNGNIVEYIKAVGKNVEVSKAESATNTNPTDAQKEAGNYKKGKVTIQGLDISIEQPRGSERTGTDENGKQWSVTMNNAYGYIRKTKGKDGDHVDVFLGANPESKTVFVVDQVNQDGSFDEHKVMLGFDSIEQAREAYLSNYEEGWQGLGNITQTDIDTFKKWAKSDTRKIKPFAEYKEIQETAPAQKEMLSEVKKRKKDGKYVVELDRRMSKTPLVLMARRALQYNGKWRKASNSIEFDNETDAKTFRENERSLGEGTHFQSSTNIFKPVNEQTFNSLVDRLRQTGLARDVVTDKAAFDAKLDEVVNDNATAKQVLSEMDTIKQEAIANNTFMLAPNGKPSKLNENQWLQVRTKPFLDWFGDWINNPEAASKVVDENGEPMVVYHATQSNFDRFSKRSMGKAIDQGTLGSGFYFTSSSENASVYAQNLHTNTGKRGGESIMPVFLSIKNPYDAQLLFEVSGDNKKESQNFTDKKKRQGYDGAKFEHRYDFAWFVAYEPTQIKSAISNNGEFDSRNPDIRMQVLEDSTNNNLVAVHNIEADQLMNALKIGGLAQPSLAIINTEIGHTGFGDITLIASRELIDPQIANRTRVFDRDIYSPSHPMLYDEIDKKKYNKWAEQFYAQRGDIVDATSMLYQMEGDVDRRRTLKSDFIRRLSQNERVQEMYLIEKGNKPRVPQSFNLRSVLFKRFENLSQLKELAKEYKSKIDKTESEIEKGKLLTEFWDESKKLYAEEQAKQREGTEASVILEAVNKNIPSTANMFGVDDINILANNITSPDTHLYKARLRDRVEGKKDFEKWVEDKVEGLFTGNRHFFNDSNKKVDYTLENVVDYMGYGNPLSKEKEMTHSLGHSNAQDAREFDTIDEIKSKSFNIVGSEEMNAHKNTVENIFEAVRDIIAEANPKVDVWNRLDGTSRALGEIAGYNRLTDEIIRREFRKEGLKAPIDVYDVAREYADALKNPPTKYFEAKAQRAVRINEFDTAVVPKGTSKELIAALKAQGLKVVQYEKHNDEERIEKVKSNARTRRLQFMRTNVGDVYGFVTPDGAVYLDSTRMNANTPIHEFGHLWNSFTKENNAELYNRGAELVKESEYWQRVNDNPSYRDLSDDAKVDEALAMAIGDKGEAIVNRNLKQRFVDWVKDVWNSIREAFGFKTDVAIEDMTLSDFTRKAVRNLLERKRLVDVMQPTVFSAQDISEMEQIKQSSIDDGSFMKAPNGEPTNLTERQWLQVRTSNFKNWFGDWQNDTENSSKIVDENGEPKVIFHGTTHQFYEFTRDRGNVENHFGIGYYFSDSLTDIENNYLATGADLTNRIDRLAEQLEDNEDLSPEEARERAEEELKGSEEIVLDVYLNMRYPMDVRPDAMYYDALEVYDEENDEYTENEDSMPMELYNALNNIQYNFSEADAQSIWNDVSDAIGGSWDGVSAYDVDKALRSSESLMYITDDEGNLASHELIRSLYEEMGYDGIIMDADLEFGNRRESGKSMDMDSDTSHYIMFDPNKIKSATENKGDFNSDMNDIRFQSVNDVADAANSTMTEDMRNELDKRIKNLWFRIREAYEDRHLAVKELLDLLRENGTEVAEHNDFYKKATHINGAIDAQLEQYNNKYQKPLNKAISELEKVGFDYRDIENYAILKHGLERNAWMKQDAINQYMANNPEATPEQIARFEQKLLDDFSGITAVEKEVGKHAEWFINDFEEKAGKDLIDNLWKRVKYATSYSLNKQLEGQLIDKKTIEDLISRYDYYVPLRGHDAEVAEDRWDYSPDMGTYFVAPLLKAKGRKTRSESPFAYIASMAQSAINSANRNILNQTILRLALKDKTKLLDVNKAWYEKTGEQDGKPVYEVRSPEYNEDPETYRKNIEEFEERMAKLAEAGLAVQSGKKLDIGGLFIKRKQADQHEVHVFQNGTEYVVYINANPAVARAINGSNAKDLHKDLRFFARVSRQMAANFTTRNPIFVASNFSRDYIFSSSILPVKENAKYALQFQRNMIPSADALQRYVRGKADLNKQQDRYLNEYILNGAKTGFSHILELQKVQKQIERDIKKGEGRNVFRYLLDGLEGMNEFAENLSRLSVYITSREQGRSITQSVSDAKEVTVNFNRSGAGGLGAAWFRSLYLFVNAGIQALSNFAKVAQKNKAKTAMLISSYAMSGFLMPMLTALIGGDDGLDDYMKLSDWERQNNLCIYTGNGFIKIPLPHELRVFHKMGDEIYQSMFGKKDVTQSLLDTALGFSDLIPANPMGAVDGSWADIMPDATKPFFQLAANRNFTGSRITNEWADPNKPGYLRVRTNKKGEPFAPAFLVKLAETLDNTTGGDGVEKGLISFNPDVVNHLMRGYFGGLYNMGMQGLDITSKTYDLTKTGEFKLKVRETPLKTFYTSESDLQTSGSGLNTKYFKVVDDTQETMRKVKGYKDQVGEGKLSVDDFAKKIENLNIPKANELYGRIKQIKKYESALKELDGQDQKDLEKIISDLKKEVIEVNNKLSE